MCPNSKRAMRMACARFEVTLRSALQDKLSYTMAVRGLVGGRSVIVRQMRTLAMVNEMSRGEMSVVAAADLARTGDPDTDGGVFPGVWSLVNKMSARYADRNVFQ